MIAIFGLAGSSLHAHKHVRTRREGNTWIAQRLESLGWSQQAISAAQQSTVISDRAAARERWQSGKRIYPCALGNCDLDQDEIQGADAREGEV